MKLLRYGPIGFEKPAIIDKGGIIRDLSNIVDDINGSMFTSGGLEKIKNTDIEKLPAVESSRIGPCVGNVGKFICIGLNYSDHAAEANLPLPTEPIIFHKATTAICGPYDEVELPRESTKVDWEVELGIVVGRKAKYVNEEEALKCIAGFCLVNDVSERDFQMARQGQWTKGKSHDTFGPIGPWLVTRDEVPDIEALDLWLDVNGVPKQRGTTKAMVFKPAFIISYLSKFMTLMPGDIIATGTPPGVGMGLKPAEFLNDGDVMTLGITGLGEQRLICVPTPI